MMMINIPIRDLKNPPALKFPERCVNCGKAKETTMRITLNMGVQKRSRTVTMQLTVPMCAACVAKERGVAKVTLIPFLIAGLLIGIVVFLSVVLIVPKGTTSQTIGFPLVVGAFAGLIVGIIGGTVVEFFVKLLAVPFYGNLLTQRPLTGLSLFSEQDQLIGISAKFLREKTLAQLTFENEQIAREFAQLNPQEKL